MRTQTMKTKSARRQRSKSRPSQQKGQYDKMTATKNTQNPPQKGTASSNQTISQSFQHISDKYTQKWIKIMFECIRFVTERLQRIMKQYSFTHSTNAIDIDHVLSWLQGFFLITLTMWCINTIPPSFYLYCIIISGVILACAHTYRYVRHRH